MSKRPTALEVWEEEEEPLPEWEALLRALQQLNLLPVVE